MERTTTAQFPVNNPQPVRVSTDSQGRPLIVQIKSTRHSVQTVRDQWADTEWEPAEQREYWLVEGEDGQLVCVFRDRTSGAWYRRRISQKAWRQRRAPLFSQG